MKSSGIEKVLTNFREKHGIPDNFRFDRLSLILQLELVQKIKRTAKRYVIGALYGDSREVIYEFDLKREYMKLNGSVYKFMLKYQKVLTYLTNYHLALLLEKYNKAEDTVHMLMKVENVSKRSSLDEFYHILISLGENACFYCGKTLGNRAVVHVDHFIPWSFVQADHLWNLVLACRNCNISKRDQVAKPSFLNILIERNERFVNLKEDIVQRKFEMYRSEKLENLYEYSVVNGFDNLWTPNVDR